MNPFPHLNFPFLMTFTWKHATLFKTWSLGKRRWSKWKRLGNSWDSKGKMNQRNSSCFSASTFRNIGIWRESVVFLVGGCFESLTMNWVFFLKKSSQTSEKWILLSCHSVGRFWWLIMSSCQAVLYLYMGGWKFPAFPFLESGYMICTYNIYIYTSWICIIYIYTWYAIIYLIHPLVANNWKKSRTNFNHVSTFPFCFF